MAALTPSKLPKMLKVIDINIEIMGTVSELYYFFATVYLRWFLYRPLPLSNTYLNTCVALLMQQINGAVTCLKSAPYFNMFTVGIQLIYLFTCLERASYAIDMHDLSCCLLTFTLY